MALANAQFLNNNCKCHFRQANYVKGGAKTVFEFDSDMMFCNFSKLGFEVFILVVDVLVPKDD